MAMRQRHNIFKEFLKTYITHWHQLAPTSTVAARQPPWRPVQPRPRRCGPASTADVSSADLESLWTGQHSPRVHLAHQFSESLPALAM